MADVATPAGAAMFDGGAVADKTRIEKPEKPDEDTYKAALKKAEKEHADSMAKLVSGSPPCCVAMGIGSLQKNILTMYYRK